MSTVHLPLSSPMWLSYKPEWDGDDADGSGKRLHGDLLEFLGVESEAHEGSADDYHPVPVTEEEVVEENVFAFYNHWIFGNAYGDDKLRLKRIEQRNQSLYDDDTPPSGQDSEPNIWERAVAMRRAQLLERLEATLQPDKDNERPPSEGVSYAADDDDIGSGWTLQSALEATEGSAAFDTQGSTLDARVSGSDGISA
ncbi:hypothetical protein DICSQDRAFT_167526 [Dichomitus squalens LYAD-421 SS1]|uniref:uncharacterized protein n=1 Tax=Dichomitus squalens (strain LYAD-421) TaxID=732165 RepID=UPI0004413AC8|nr:uncharacterized protein DICSQDRAFT_167526 [Dichomitus squalens LYAD-421 SS1]EJF64365.1 hypothetical protein DICSQDRAFT_167526 [Dichomitus squalens LYAD-421 SS1]